jgi:geranylgeranyl reductase family protein
MRPQFDQFLAARAAQAGAEVRDAQPVTRIEFDDRGASLSTRNETLHTPLVVAADGVNSLVRRAAKFPAHRRLGVALEAELQVPLAALEEWRSVLHLDFGAIPWGYGWIFPKADHLSVGIGALLGRNQHLDLRAELARYIRSEPSLAGAQELLTRGHRVPLGGQMGRYHSPHAVLVGDAAGIVDPFTAEGIYYAILSGQMAAEEIVRAFAHDGLPELSAYTRRINAEINADLSMAWTLNKIFYRVPHFAYRVFKKSRTVQNAAAEMMMGALTYPQMMLRILKKTPRALLRA